MANFNQAFDDVIGVEGKYSNHPADRGGPTNWGITQGRYSEYLGRAATVSEVKSMTKATAKIIYKKFYWDAMGLDQIVDETLASLLFDQGVNRGTVTAIKELQGVLNTHFNKGVSTDGKLGPETLMAIESVNKWDMQNKFIQNAQDDYVRIVKSNETQLVFLGGWINRSQVLYDKVFEEVKRLKDAAVAPLPVKEQPDMNGWEKVIAGVIEALVNLVKGKPQEPEEPKGNTGEPILTPVPQKYMFAVEFLRTQGISEKHILLWAKHWAEKTTANNACFLNFNRKDTERRYHRFSLKDQRRFDEYVSHGKQSDPDDDGFATMFSNVSGSNKSCVGLFECAETYIGGNGESLRLDGLSETNNKMRPRYIVMHPSNYVPGGRSLGCPAFAKAVAGREIQALKNGSPGYIYHKVMVG